MVSSRMLLMYAVGVLVCCNQPALADIECPLNDPLGCKLSDSAIGEAYSSRRGDHRRSLLSKDNKVEGVAIQEGPLSDVSARRKLLQSGCSSTDGGAAAVHQCTNAVRADPRAFTREYPCDPYWLTDYDNKYRRPLSSHPNLSNAAQAHSQDQANKRRMTHTGSDGSNVGDRAKRSGYNYNGIAENVAYGHRSARAVVLAWMCSSGHRRNIMNCQYSDMGNGAAQASNGQIYHTQVFGCQRGYCDCSGGPAPVTTSAPGPTPRNSFLNPAPTPTPTQNPFPTQVPGPQPTATPNPFHSNRFSRRRGTDFPPFDFQSFSSQGGFPSYDFPDSDPFGAKTPAQPAPGGGFSVNSRLCQRAGRLRSSLC